ncbi:MAG: phosphoadenylyl-sulfate reductase [Sulfobacillus sp.]
MTAGPSGDRRHSVGRSRIRLHTGVAQVFGRPKPSLSGVQSDKPEQDVISPMLGFHEGDVAAADTGKQTVARLSADCGRMTAEETVARVLRTVPRVALACSFGAEDMVLLDMVMAIQRDPDACCALRKVKPLENLLAGYDGWITGIRRDQSPARSNARAVEWDERFGLVKVNPLADWTMDQVWSYIRTHGVPYNPLHDRGYPSIGCIHCTRAVNPGEDARSGRWSHFAKTECGLHAGG